MTETTLTPAQRAALRRAQRRFERNQERARVIFRGALERLIDDGASVAAIARELGVSRQAVHDRLKRGSP